MIFLDKEADPAEVKLVTQHHTDEETGERSQEILWARRSGAWSLAVGKRERAAGEEVLIDYVPQAIHRNVLIGLSQESVGDNSFNDRSPTLEQAETDLSNLLLELPSA